MEDNNEKIIKNSIKDNKYEVNFYNNSDLLLIQIKSKEMIPMKIYEKTYSFEELQKNKYFLIFDNIDEIILQLNILLKSEESILIEDTNYITLMIPLKNNVKIKEIIFKIELKEKNTIETINELGDIINNYVKIIKKIENENNELKNKVNNIEKENNELKNKVENLEKENNDIKIKFENIEKNMKKNNYKNFHWVNNSVKIINNSPYYDSYTPEIILGKYSSLSYYLSDGNSNHFIEFEISNKKIFLEKIRIKVDDYECTIKDFKVSFLNDNEQWELIGQFQRVSYKDNPDFQEFNIKKECNKIRLDLINVWGSYGGNFILIKKLDFYIADIE